MRTSLFRDAFILAALFGLIWAAFVYYPVLFPSAEDFEISIENEEKLGRVIVDNMMDKNTQVIYEDYIDSAITIITNRLLENLDYSKYNYHFKVIRNSEINAFTLPGGNIFIYSGLIEFCETPEEFAAVLAHEIGHAEKRHVVKKLAKELGVTVLFTVLTGGDATVMKEISKTILSTVFDREAEKEADAFAFQLLEKSGINPKVFAKFFKRLNDQGKSYDASMEILMTHPHNDSRIEEARRYLLSKDFKERKLEVDWNKMKERVQFIDEY
jgi:predicted Zn-dependent protease